MDSKFEKMVSNGSGVEKEIGYLETVCWYNCACTIPNESKEYTVQTVDGLRDRMVWYNGNPKTKSEFVLFQELLANIRRGFPVFIDRREATYEDLAKLACNPYFWYVYSGGEYSLEEDDTTIIFTPGGGVAEYWQASDLRGPSSIVDGDDVKVGRYRLSSMVHAHKDPEYVKEDDRTRKSMAVELARLGW